METNPDHEPTVDVHESDNGVLDVIIRTVSDDELKELQESRRRPPKPVH
jgi:hypothetical protein